MSRFFKSAAFPILIVVVLAFFANRLINPSPSGQPYGYSSFQADLAQGNVQSAVIKTKDNTLVVTVRGPPKAQHEVGFVPDNGNELVNELKAARVEFNVEGTKTNGWLSLLTYVLPFLIFIGFWIFLMNQVQGGG